MNQTVQVEGTVHRAKVIIMAACCHRRRRRGRRTRNEYFVRHETREPNDGDYAASEKVIAKRGAERVRGGGRRTKRNK